MTYYPNNLFHFINPIHQHIHFIFRVIQIEGGAAGGRDSKFLVQRLRTVMPGTDGDPIPIKDLRNIMWMNAIESKCRHATLFIC